MVNLKKLWLRACASEDLLCELDREPTAEEVDEYIIAHPELSDRSDDEE